MTGMAKLSTHPQYGPEPLFDGADYLPARDDKRLLASGELECHEVKGFWRDDARVKIKVAASIYPFRFVAVRKVKGGFTVEEF